MGTRRSNDRERQTDHEAAFAAAFPTFRGPHRIQVPWRFTSRLDLTLLGRDRSWPARHSVRMLTRTSAWLRCRAWNNADDGGDFYAANDVVVVDSSWAFLNGVVTGANPNGDGNGFKLGGEPDGADQGGAVHRLTSVAAFENKKCGYTRNNNPSNPTLSDCGTGDNDGGDFCEVSCSGTHAVGTSGSSAKGLARMSDGSLPDLP